MSDVEFNIPLTFQEMHIILSALEGEIDFLGNQAHIIPDKERTLHKKILGYGIKYEKKRKTSTRSS